MPATLTKATPGPPREARYQKLRPGLRGANGLSRDQVALHQRTRLYEAMVEIAASGGYQTTTIKAVCALAGVSRQTFYDLFGADKEECFLGAYDYIVDRTVKRIALAYRSEQDPERLCRAFEQFGREVLNEPEAARVALVEVLGGGPTAVARMRRTRLIFERMIGASLSEGPDGVTLSPLIVKGIVCGVERITRRLLTGDVKELPARADELRAWALSYRSPAAATLTVTSPTRGDQRPELWRARARVENDRARILCCAAQIAATRGYAQLTPAQIVGAAQVTEARFDELFQSTEQCFLDAQDRLGLEALVCAARASQSSEDRLVGVHRGIVALMRHVATHPVLVRVAFVEIFAVGPAGIQRRERLLGQFADQLVRSLPRSRAPSSLVAEASVGAIWGIVHDHVTRGAIQLLPGLAGHATYLALAPVIGAEAAVRVILAHQSR